MKYFEFGKNNDKLAVLFHGGGICYRAAVPTAEVLSKKYHVVLVAYDGFDPSEPETEFKSVMDEAKRLGDYVLEKYGGKIDILYGVSFGCRILREALADTRLTITTTIADGMETYDYPDIKSEWGKKLIAKAMGRSLEDVERILYPGATYQSWKNQDYSCFGRHFNFEDFKRTDMYIWHGINSSVEKKLAANIKKWQDAGYAFTYKVFTDLGHGGLAAEYPEKFLMEVTAAHENSLKKKRTEKRRLIMNWLRTILDSIIICIAFNSVVAFVWLLEPVGFSVMLPKGINTPVEKLTKAQLKPLRLMEFIMYPILLAYIILSAYDAGINGFLNLFLTAYIENLCWNFGDFFLLDWLLREKYTDRLMVPGTEDNEMWKTGPWMRKFGIFDHWVKGPILCALLSLLCAGIGMLIR